VQVPAAGHASSSNASAEGNHSSKKKTPSKRTIDDVAEVSSQEMVASMPKAKTVKRSPAAAAQTKPDRTSASKNERAAKTVAPLGEEESLPISSAMLRPTAPICEALQGRWTPQEEYTIVQSYALGKSLSKDPVQIFEQIGQKISKPYRQVARHYRSVLKPWVLKLERYGIQVLSLEPSEYPSATADHVKLPMQSSSSSASPGKNKNNPKRMKSNGVGGSSSTAVTDTVDATSGNVQDGQDDHEDDYDLTDVDEDSAAEGEIAWGVKQKYHKSTAKSVWTHELDAELTRLVLVHDNQWVMISKMLGAGVSAHACKCRWANHLNPRLKQTPWTVDDERTLCEQVQYEEKEHARNPKHPIMWSTVARMVDRSPVDAKAHWLKVVKPFVELLAKEQRLPNNVPDYEWAGATRAQLSAEDDVPSPSFVPMEAFPDEGDNSGLLYQGDAQQMTYQGADAEVGDGLFDLSIPTPVLQDHDQPIDMPGIPTMSFE
jgi:hypothetical protein